MVLYLIALLLAVLSNIWPMVLPVIGWYVLALLVLADFPVTILLFVLDRYPFRKFKRQFTFRKYHNTDDHDSLW